MLITGPELIRVEPDGSRVRQADLSHISPLGWSELTVDGRGNVYVNTPHLRALRMGDQTGPPLNGGSCEVCALPDGVCLGQPRGKLVIELFGGDDAEVMHKQPLRVRTRALDSRVDDAPLEVEIPGQ
jgi:hypothetical protein